MADSFNAELYAYGEFALFMRMPMEIITYWNQSEQGGQSNFNSKTTSNTKVVKKTGSCARAKNKEVISTSKTSKTTSNTKVVKKTGSCARATKKEVISTKQTSKTTSNKKVVKQTRSCACAKNKEVNSTRETFKERSTGVGYQDEYKNTSTYRYEDESGYTEYQVEERFRNVSYGGTNSSNKGKRKYIM